MRPTQSTHTLSETYRLPERFGNTRSDVNTICQSEQPDVNTVFKQPDVNTKNSRLNSQNVKSQPDCQTCELDTGQRANAELGRRCSGRSTSTRRCVLCTPVVGMLSASLRSSMQCGGDLYKQGGLLSRREKTFFSVHRL